MALAAPNPWLVGSRHDGQVTRDRPRWATTDDRDVTSKECIRGSTAPWTSESKHSRPIEEVHTCPWLRAAGPGVKGPMGLSERPSPKGKNPIGFHFDTKRSKLQTEPNEVRSFHGRLTELQRWENHE